MKIHEFAAHILLKKITPYLGSRQSRTILSFLLLVASSGIGSAFTAMSVADIIVYGDVLSETEIVLLYPPSSHPSASHFSSYQPFTFHSSSFNPPSFNPSFAHPPFFHPFSFRPSPFGSEIERDSLQLFNCHTGDTK